MEEKYTNEALGIKTVSIKDNNTLTLEQLVQKVENLTKAVHALDEAVTDLNKNSDIQFDILSNNLDNLFSILSEKLDSFSSLMLKTITDDNSSSIFEDATTEVIKTTPTITVTKTVISGRKTLIDNLRRRRFSDPSQANALLKSFGFEKDELGSCYRNSDLHLKCAVKPDDDSEELVWMIVPFSTDD